MSGSVGDSWSSRSSTSSSSSSRDSQTSQPRRNYEEKLRYRDSKENTRPDFFPCMFPGRSTEPILFPNQHQVNNDSDRNGTAYGGSNWTNN